MKLLKKILRIGGAGKLMFCLVFSFFVFGYWVFQFFYQCKDLRLSYEVAFFCTMDGFFRILKKDFIPSIMHTTVFEKESY